MRGDAGLVDEAVGELDARAVARALAPLRSLTVTGRPLPSRAARATATARSGSLSSAAPGAGLADLRHRAAHVEVDQVDAGRGDGRGGAERMTSGSCAEELHARPGARRGGSAAARASCARCRGARRSSRPSRETASPAPKRCACRRTNQLPIPASGASATRLGIADRRRGSQRRSGERSASRPVRPRSGRALRS